MSDTDPLRMNPSDLTTRYSDVTWAMTHDSHTAAINRPNFQSVGGGTSGIPVDQTQTVYHQLQGGIRAVRVSSGMSHGRAVLHHGGSTLGQRYWDFSLYLAYIQAFLIANPSEIVTIIDEGSATDWDDESDSTYENAIVQTYRDVFGTASGSTPNVVFAPGSKKADGTSFPTAQALAQGAPWPTLKELIDANQRLIVFMTNGYPKESGHDWILNAYGQGTSGAGLMFSSDYNYYGNEFGNTRLCRPAKVDTQLKAPSAGTPGASRLYLFQHFFYHHEDLIVKSIDQGWQKYSKWTVGDLLVANVARTVRQTGRVPNFINVDFHQGVFGARSYLVPLVKLLNTPAIRGVTGSLVSATRGIHIQDTSSEDITAIHDRRTTYTVQDLFVGGQYRVRLAGSDKYLTCAPAAPTEPHQQTTYPFALAPRSDSAHQTFTLSYVVSDPAPVVQPQGVAMVVDFYNHALGATTKGNSHPQLASLSPSDLAAVDNRGVEIVWVSDQQWIIRPAGDPFTTLTNNSDDTLRFEYMASSPTKWTFESLGAKVPEFLPRPAPTDFAALTPPVLTLSGNSVTATYSDTIDAASAYEAQLIVDGKALDPIVPMQKYTTTSTVFGVTFALDNVQGTTLQVQVRPVKTNNWVAPVNTITRLSAPNLSHPAYSDGTPGLIAVSLANFTPNAQTYVGQLVLKGVPTGNVVPLSPYANNTTRVVQFYTNDPSAQVRVRASAPGYLDSPWTTSAPGR